MINNMQDGNSILCTRIVCSNWVYKRCSGVMSRMNKAMNFTGSVLNGN